MLTYILINCTLIIKLIHFIICFVVTEVNQPTTPAELPIAGDPFSDITLDLVFPKGKPVFILNGKKLQLLSTLDRDQDNLSHIVFQVNVIDNNLSVFK